MTLFPDPCDANSKYMCEMAKRAAKAPVTILLTGETGSGKEWLARLIHQHSLVQSGPFVSVNCAALPAQMIEAILFGYEKGAFTGAIQQHIGKFEQAQNGTLLLDEITELPLELQAKLLRVLQERELERLGGKSVVKLQIRIIAATNLHLQHCVQEGTFREDLYYRLSVFPIHCVALRDRQHDILPLARFFIHKYANVFQVPVPRLTEAAVKKLRAYSWPGNIREMENVIQRTLVMANKMVLDAEDFVLVTEMLSMTQGLKEAETNLIISTLKETAGRRDMAAQKLKMSPRTLRYKLSKLKLSGVSIP